MKMNSANAALVLEDGTTFDGKPFGKAGKTFGETVFYTGVVGYQEVVTNPSYKGTLAVFTYPIIGSYGVNDEDGESPDVQAAGVVIREYSRYFSNFRAKGAFEDYLAERGVVGIREVDTRAVAVHLREHGEMRGAIVSGDFDPKALAAELENTPGSFQRDLVKELSREETRGAVGEEKHRIAALDLGIKRSLLDQFARLGCSLRLLRCTAGAADLLANDPEGVVLAGGPGDPRVLDYAVETTKSLLGKVPVLGIGLGHQVLALALGCKVKRIKAGHRGVNYPVKDLTNGKCHITAQHHSFVVDEGSLPGSVEVTHTNVNDGTIEGIRSRDFRAVSVQFHPCPDEKGCPNELLGAVLRGLKAEG